VGQRCRQRQHEHVHAANRPLAGAILLTTDYSSSDQDALRAVLEHNERQEAEFERHHPDAP